MQQVLRQAKVETPFPDALLQLNKSNYINSSSLLGIEVEVENIKNPVSIEQLWAGKEDGSLRNYGVEFISYPSPAEYAPALFDVLLQEIKRQDTPIFSKRTSIHVHVNVQDISLEQLKSFLILYLCFEKLFFKYAGEERENSIFCVPISQAGYVGIIKNLLNVQEDRYHIMDILNNWHKYTSMNLRTIKRLGTVEFRHLHGTDNQEIFTGWVKLITSLKEKARNTNLVDLYSSIKDLNTNSQYEMFAYSILGDARELLSHSLQDLMEENITFIKECFEQDLKKDILTMADTSSSFFKSHKIKEKASTVFEKQINKMSEEELKILLEELRKAYKECTSDITRMEITNNFILVESRINSFGGF